MYILVSKWAHLLERGRRLNQLGVILRTSQHSVKLKCQHGHGQTWQGFQSQCHNQKQTVESERPCNRCQRQWTVDYVSPIIPTGVCPLHLPDTSCPAASIAMATQTSTDVALLLHTYTHTLHIGMIRKQQAPDVPLMNSGTTQCFCPWHTISPCVMLQG